MAVTLNIDELKNLTQLLEAAIAKRGEYCERVPGFNLGTWALLRLEICAQCDSIYFDGGCQCDNDD